MPDYNFKKIEKKWSKKWLDDKIYEPDLDKPSRPFYNLMMFPYPSAEGIHVGNMYAFVGTDIYGRKKRMEGKDVFEPIGLDGFGIHSENYALKVGRNPKKQAEISEKNFYAQLQKIGNGFAWDERLETYDPEYYKWTQWIFAKMFENGLAYRKKAKVNWCSSCLTVLADEQVLHGDCERCATEVVQKELEQWFFRITDYAEKLLNDLDDIDWSEHVKIAQKNWIGRSEGALIRFPLQATVNKLQSVEIFTTRPDTLYGATYLVLSPEHELLNSKLQSKIQNWEEVKKYIAKSKKKTKEERVAENKNLPSYEVSAKRKKTGVELKGIKAINPATKEEIPVWVADYVMSGYGTGAIMAVPAHDQRDFEFAKKFELPIKQVVEPVFIQTTQPGAFKEGERAKTTEGVIVIVKHWEKDEYTGIRWKKVSWGTLLTGGVEGGESPEKTALKEVREETGFLNPKIVKKIGVVHGKFYHVPKRENRSTRGHVFYVELEDGQREEIAEEEKELHEVKWLKLGELEKFLTAPTHVHAVEELKNGPRAYEGEGILAESSVFSEMWSREAKKKIAELVGAKPEVKYHLRDWLISRQRYWGPPIPLIFCENCAVKIKNQKSKTKIKEEFNSGELENPGWIAVEEKDLPVLLPDVKDFRPTGTDKSPLATIEDFVKTKCPKCGGDARRETDVSDTFLDSAWYYFGYLFENWKLKIENSSFSNDRVRKWLPVDMYIGGAEHSVLHLLYARFLAKVFKDWGLVEFGEPFEKFRVHGLLIKDGVKMSKSKGNVINPDEYIEKFGADVLRMYLMFLGPFGQGGDFRDESIAGIDRFLSRVWKLGDEIKSKNEKGETTSKNLKLNTLLHQSIKKVGEDIEKLHYNTAISQLMILLKTIEEKKDHKLQTASYKIFLRLLSPFAPFVTEELWYELGESGSIHKSKWPEADASKIKEETKTIVVQVNGKIRDKFGVSADTDDEKIKKEAMSRPKIKEILSQKTVRKTIVARGRLVNIVI